LMNIGALKARVTQVMVITFLACRIQLETHPPILPKISPHSEVQFIFPPVQLVGLGLLSFEC
jgi:hypothetical protein